MVEVVGLSNTPTRRGGYIVTTKSAAATYVTTLRFVENEDDVVEVTERCKIEDRYPVDIDPVATETVEEVLADRGVTVA